MGWRRRVLALVLLGWVGVAWGQTGGPPAVIYLIRHAEKLTDGREDLSAKGFARAQVLVRMFVPAAGREALAKPQVVIATKASARSNRPVQTVAPLAAALGVPVESDVANEDYAALAGRLLGGGYAGKVVLVSWHHGKIPALVRALGAVPPYDPWPAEQFDRVWKIVWVGGKATVTDLPEGVMEGDSK